MIKKIFSFLFFDKEIKEDVLFLKKIDVFKTFTLWQLKKITTVLFKRTYLKNEIIYNKNEETKLICLLKSGKIELFDGQNKSYILPNSKFGKKFMFCCDDRYSETAKASEESEVYIIHKDDLAHLGAARPLPCDAVLRPRVPCRRCLGGQAQMRARDVFNEAREAKARIDDLQERLVLMHERIGMQGRALESCFGQSLDPMRKVDDLLDWEMEEYDSIMAASRAAIEDATELVWGLARMGYQDAADALRMYYIEGMDLPYVSDRQGYRADVVQMMLDTALSFIDEQGMAKVKEAGR